MAEGMPISKPFICDASYGQLELFCAMNESCVLPDHSATAFSKDKYISHGCWHSWICWMMMFLDQSVQLTAPVIKSGYDMESCFHYCFLHSIIGKLQYLAQRAAGIMQFIAGCEMCDQYPKDREGPGGISVFGLTFQCWRKWVAEVH